MRVCAVVLVLLGVTAGLAVGVRALILPTPPLFDGLSLIAVAFLAAGWLMSLPMKSQ